MTRYLLDSHSFLWYEGGIQLSAEHRAALDDPANELHLSVASIWELTIKRSIGRLQSATSFRAEALRLQIQILPILAEHAEMVERLPRHHNDPFDHMLLAQAMVEGLVLVTHDRALHAYNVPMLRV
jgi:PIN domain nuclease of toxin-antitoxin system